LPAGSIYNGSEKFPVEFATQPCEQAVA
jgi:hypothetical protein